MSRILRRWCIAGAAGVSLVLLASACAAPSGDAGTGFGEVLNRDFPDPDVIHVDGAFYAYSTESNRRNVPVARSTDGIEWEIVGDALPTLPSWVIPGKTWAPEVVEFAPGDFRLYFTATNFRPTMQCVGVASATSPLGPFVVAGDSMIVCPHEQGGAIDATTVHDGERWHLVWKNDGNAIGVDTWIQAAPLADDGLSLAGDPIRLIKQDQQWEGDIVEAPTIIAGAEGYTLLYSANGYWTDDYAVGYATARSLEGPWTKAEGPWLTMESTGGIRGPGGQDVVVGEDGRWRVFVHGWDTTRTVRALYSAPMHWDGLVPVLD